MMVTVSMAMVTDYNGAAEDSSGDGDDEVGNDVDGSDDGYVSDDIDDDGSDAAAAGDDGSCR